MSGLWLGLGTLIVATPIGLLWRSRQGRVRITHQNTAPQNAGAQNAGAENAGAENAGAENTAVAALPEPVLRRLDRTAAVTLLQLTAPICARCPQASALLSELAAQTSGVRHAELDLAAYPELAGQLRIRSTPTTLVLSRTGHELFRISGVPRRAELLQALQPHL